MTSATDGSHTGTRARPLAPAEGEPSRTGAASPRLGARVLGAGALVAAAIAVAAGLRLDRSGDVDPLLLALALALCAGASAFEALAVRRLRCAFPLHQVFFFWAAVLLPSWAVALVAVTCFGPGRRLQGASWLGAAIEVARWTLAGLGAHAVAWSVGAFGAPAERTVAELLAAACAFVAVHRGVGALAARLAGERRTGSARREAADGIRLDLALAGTGACLAVLWTEGPLLLALAAGPIALAYRALWVPMLAEKARTDSKTGLVNFETFTSEFEAALLHAERSERPLSLVMLDLDHLRMVNNRAGHLAGDRVIRAVADILSEIAGPEGIVGRFGGEEYAVLLPGGTLPKTCELAETARARVEALRLRSDDGLSDLRVTISAGVASFPEHGNTTTALLSAADTALYDAKLGGRNRVRIALPPGAREVLDGGSALHAPPAPATLGTPQGGGVVATRPAVVSSVTPPRPEVETARARGAAGADTTTRAGGLAAEDTATRASLAVRGTAAARERLAWLRARSRAGAAELRRGHPELESDNARLRSLLDENQRLLGRLHGSYLATITSLASTIEAKDPYTGGHTERVAEIALLVAEELDFDDAQLRAVRIGAAIHDIGKVGVSDEILLKDGVLSSSESAAVRRHPEIASRILAELELPATVKQMVRSHHERYDGAGYPDGLAGEEIPLAARILTVAEALDAMTSDRPYRAGMALAVARSEIEAKTGTHFCPRVVEALNRCLDRDPRLRVEEALVA